MTRYQPSSNNPNERFLTNSDYYSSIKRTAQIPTVLKIIKDFDADIICLQEVSHDLITNVIATNLSQNYTRAVEHTKGKDGGICIFFKNDDKRTR